MKKIKDLVVKTGSYTKNDGTEAAIWLKIGTLFEGDKGQFILLDKTFNPAGVTDGGGKVRTNIMVSLFDPKDNNAPASQSNHDQAKSNGYQQQQEPLDDDAVPF